MILIGEDRNTRSETCTTATFFTTSHLTESGSNPALRSERPSTSRLRHNTAMKIKINHNFIYRYSPYRAVDLLRFDYKRQSCSAT
jgi:hypothetical protein